MSTGSELDTETGGRWTQPQGADSPHREQVTHYSVKDAVKLQNLTFIKLYNKKNIEG